MPGGQDGREEKRCPYTANCPFFNDFHLPATGRVFKNLYCESGFERCERYRLRRRGERPSPELWPNGRTGSAKAD
ncbi:MAG: hypothetical protein GF403_07000 [Candidatus Coatesbacteria bacterium]|nr:hypothetical protein [Candidatus Coatesbacteria bacterium]